jgi:carboxyl-terminal processing protease
MRRLLVLALLGPAPGLLTAAPLPPSSHPAPAPRGGFWNHPEFALGIAPTDDSDLPESQVFAQQLFHAVNQIAQYYFRPVSRADLAYTALAGLYDAARRPRPDRLREEVERAAAAQALMTLFARTREAVGDAGPLRGGGATLACCRALVRSLDPYSDVVLGVEQRRSIGLEQEACGVGLEVGEPSGGPLLVRAVYPGGPAQRAGLRPGDELLVLNGQLAGRLTADQVQRLLTAGPPAPEDLVSPRGPTPPLEATYRRPGVLGSAVVLLAPERFRPEAVLGVRREDDNGWDYWADAGRRLAHVRLTTLSRGASTELRDVLKRLKDEGMQGLILDLRWCNSGYLDEAIDAARLFLERGPVVTVQSRGRADMVYLAEDRHGPGCGCPLVVLVNGETRGGAELIAAALQDHRRAAVVGARTRGKGNSQSPIPLLLPQTELKLTTGVFVRPSGRNLHRHPDSSPADDWGVRPDVEFRVSPELDRTLAAWWRQQTLRPGPSSERLPLDDPHADPCREAALEALTGRIPVSAEGVQKVE